MGAARLLQSHGPDSRVFATTAGGTRRKPLAKVETPHDRRIDLRYDHDDDGNVVPGVLCMTWEKRDDVLQTAPDSVFWTPEQGAAEMVWAAWVPATEESLGGRGEDI